MRAREFYNEAIRIFSNKAIELSGDFYTFLNHSITKIVLDLKAGNQIYSKEISEGIRFVEVGENVLDVLYCWINVSGQPLKLFKTTLPNIDFYSNQKGIPRFFTFTNVGTPHYSYPVPCIVFDVYTSMPLIVNFWVKEIPPEIKNLDDTINLPNFTINALKYYLFFMLAQKFLDPRANIYFQLYENEINKINDEYFEEEPVIRTRVKRIIYFNDEKMI